MATPKLDPTGLTQLWSKIVELFATKASVTKLSQVVENKAAKATTLEGYGITDAYTKEEVNTELAKKANTATTLAGYGITDAYTKEEVDDVVDGIKADIASVYKVKGSVAFAALPTEGMVAGDVYNVNDAFTASDAFVTAEQGKEFPAGTNVVYTADGWDCLAGTYDFSNFAMKSDIPGAITEAQINEICVLPADETE